MTQSLSELAGVPRFPREHCKETSGLRRAYLRDIISAIKRSLFQWTRGIDSDEHEEAGFRCRAPFLP